MEDQIPEYKVITGHMAEVAGLQRKIVDHIVRHGTTFAVLAEMLDVKAGSLRAYVSQSGTPRASNNIVQSIHSALIEKSVLHEALSDGDLLRIYLKRFGRKNSVVYFGRKNDERISNTESISLCVTDYFFGNRRHEEQVEESYAGNYFMYRFSYRGGEVIKSYLKIGDEQKLGYNDHSDQFANSFYFEHFHPVHGIQKRFRESSGFFARTSNGLLLQGTSNNGAGMFFTWLQEPRSRHHTSKLIGLNALSSEYTGISFSKCVLLPTRLGDKFYAERIKLEDFESEKEGCSLKDLRGPEDSMTAFSTGG